MGCDFQEGGSQILNVIGERMASTVKGPYHLGASFFKGRAEMRFFADSHTFSLIFQGSNFFPKD
jgi:hypothetical protein